MLTGSGCKRDIDETTTTKQYLLFVSDVLYLDEGEGFRAVVQRDNPLICCKNNEVSLPKGRVIE